MLPVLRQLLEMHSKEWAGKLVKQLASMKVVPDLPKWEVVVCHGDVRLSNMVLAEPAEDSTLIDFDLAAFAGAPQNSREHGH
mmetsp:Transcript_22172/g.87356  ORF Transcript_22172/g.87356 Transcript_22172/m.87356 type:complete len:82 (-) Transcript_22172:163-408(-)